MGISQGAYGFNWCTSSAAWTIYRKKQSSKSKTWPWVSLRMAWRTWCWMLDSSEAVWCLHTLLFLQTMLGLQAQRFVGQQQFPSSGWPKVYRTQGSRGWRWSLSSNPAIKKQEVSCVPNTPNTTRSCIGALVRRRDGKIWVIGVAEQVNLNKKCSKVASGKREHKRYCKGGNKA